MSSHSYQTEKLGRVDPNFVYGQKAFNPYNPDATFKNRVIPLR